MKCSTIISLKNFLYNCLSHQNSKTIFHNYANISMKSHVCLPILLEFLGSFQFTISAVLMQNYSKLWIGGEN